MKQKGQNSGENKQESRFPWIFKTDGKMQYFGKIEKHVYFYSSKDVDTQIISEEIEKSRILGLSIDVLRNEIVRVLSICTKNSVFVISLNQSFVNTSLFQCLSSLKSKIMYGYDITNSLQLLKKSYGITIQAKDLHIEEEYCAKFKELENSSGISTFISKSNQEIQAVNKFDTIHSLSNPVMLAMTQPAVLSYYFITEVYDNSCSDFSLPFTLFQHSSAQQDKLISPPFALLPSSQKRENTSNLSMSLCERYGILFPQNEFPDKNKNNQPEEEEQKEENDQNTKNMENNTPNNTKINQKKTVPLQIQTNPNASPQRNAIPVKRIITKSIQAPNKSELQLQPSKRSKSPGGVQEPVFVKPLVIVKDNKTPRNETPPPQQLNSKESPDTTLLKIEGRKRKDSMPISSQLIVTKKRHNEFCEPNCVICGQTLNSTISLAAHIITTHIEEKFIYDVFKRTNCPNYVCSYCNQYFMDKSVFTIHIVDKHTKEIAQLISRIPIKEQREQIIKFFQRLAEEVNDIITDDSWDALRRLEREMMKKNIITTVQSCPACNMDFETNVDLLHHCYTAHDV